MENIAVYCSWADAQIETKASYLETLPTEFRSLILESTGSRYLDSLGELTRLSQFSDTLIPLYRPLLPDLVARWLSPSLLSTIDQNILTLSSLGRVLPLATYVRPHVKQALQLENLQQLFSISKLELAEINEDNWQLLLLALFRLLSYDRDILTGVVSPTFFFQLFHHEAPVIRYLAVQCYCRIIHFADALTQEFVHRYVGTNAILGQWEGRAIDYRVLKLWEEQRWTRLFRSFADVENEWQRSPPLPTKRLLNPLDLSPCTAGVGGVLLARDGPLEISSSIFVETPTAKRNLQQLGSCLLQSKPVLICGQSSSGKTTLVHEAARLLNKVSSMVTLHLNEQTDAKSLIGIYTSSPHGEAFRWQAGILTEAIQQGRWVLIEDIDRAPAEVMGVLRPVLESGELYLPNRKETIKPRDGFRIIATLRTGGRSSHILSSRGSWFMNSRIWCTAEIATYESVEIELLLRSRYSAAEPYIPTILQVHQQVQTLYKEDDNFKSLQGWSPSLRTLLTWTRRVHRRLQTAKQISGAMLEATKIEIFKDAIDCYGGYLNDMPRYQMVGSAIASQMGISPQQAIFVLEEGIVSISENTTSLTIGRNVLSKTAARRRQYHSPPFALTTQAQTILERISAGISFSEPCLLVGETGVGKTTLVQHVASLVGQKLTVVNLSQQSEASDLLGGLKPVTTRSLVMPTVETFNTLFEDTFSTKRNESFKMALTKAVAKQNWARLIILWQEAIQLASDSLNSSSEPSTPDGTSHISKRRKLATPKYDALRRRWADFANDFRRIQAHVEHDGKTHTFAFVEGRLVKAVREGEWLLLDEINLATSDTLDYIVSLLNNGDDGKPTLLLAEAGNITSVVAHPNFRIFGAMNPATDAGKKDLPPGLRSRFTEIYVHSGDDNVEDLTIIIRAYLGSQLASDKRAALDLARVYLGIRELNQDRRLTDGAGDIPHFSIRSLVRCLLYVQKHGASHGLRRAMYEGFAMSFFTVLSRASEAVASPVVEKHLLSSIKNKKAFWSQQPKFPHDDDFIAFKHHLVKKGRLTPDFQPHYIRTASVERNLLNLARAASMQRFPILLQGPTSAGKTSMVEYLAKLSGNKFVRINNHEHTDLQEYLGSYASDTDGRLLYKEGVLVDALRQGHWIVLDELNLAPSDVLEALNRLLDDNRELLIPETQEIVRPHPNFMLFATQNPAGLYGGRKRLSRAFRNRFLELHFDDIPEDELGTILEKRSQIAPTYCKEIVAVYKKLSLQRQSSRLFEQRNSFATLRDLFRWAARPVPDRQSLAHHGYMLLAERVRDSAERIVVKKTIEETMKVKIDEDVLYGLSAIPSSVQARNNIVWTYAMRRLFVLVTEALKNNEPVLLIGETGCGKTQICQTIAEAMGRPLNIYNAHTNTETGDLIGSQRPIRNREELTQAVIDDWVLLAGSIPAAGENTYEQAERVVASFASLDKQNYDHELFERLRVSIGTYQSLFVWSDGSLVRSMRTGEHFLLDEISLADDSVLERLNSVLEPSRTILLAEKGSFDNLVVADPNFQFLATMNPGGDYGKRELSAALRNRLTEIWVPPLSKEADILPIIQKKLKYEGKQMAEMMIQFAVWFRQRFYSNTSTSIPLRDLLAWVDFVNCLSSPNKQISFIHGAAMVFIDSIGASPAGMISSGSTDVRKSRHECAKFLQSLVDVDVPGILQEVPELKLTQERLHVGPFSIPRIDISQRNTPDLVFEAPTTLRNIMRIVRALQMSRPILLEGSPGVGKTAIVTALAQASGKHLTRINLSDQTDLMDLFGADAPSQSEQVGRFSWRNGPLLNAMQSGGWVLLDEMNLASQSVLEGLNACLDHRHEVYIAELDKTFLCHPDFMLFAAQNPHHQGGGRKGLPASFVNRFTVVYADSFGEADLLEISRRKFPGVTEDNIRKVIKTVCAVEADLAQQSIFGQGGPWELNLRDVSRWLQLCQQYPTTDSLYHFGSIVTGRFRSEAQKALVTGACLGVSAPCSPESFYYNITTTSLQVGLSHLARNRWFQPAKEPPKILSPALLSAAKSAVTAIDHKWPIVLTGASGSGKTTLVRHLAALAGAHMVEFSMNADVDTIDLIGGFEQFDHHRDITKIWEDAITILSHFLSNIPDTGTDSLYEEVLKTWSFLASRTFDIGEFQTMLSAMSSHVPKLSALEVALAEIIRRSKEARSTFVWNDGLLVDAVERGFWLVLDNANLCNPAVLDRLNSLLEPGGKLVVSEQHESLGGDRTIEPHPDFRIFLTTDPRYGELSRAMRNRSLEIFLPTIGTSDETVPLLQYPADAVISRLRYLCDADLMNTSKAIEACFDNLSASEAVMLRSKSDLLPVQHDSYVLLNELAEIHSLSATPVGTQSNSLTGTDYMSEHHAQLLTLNEPYAMKIIKTTGYPTPDLFTRVWYIKRRVACIFADLRTAVKIGRSLPGKAQTVLQKSAIAAENGIAGPPATLGTFVKYVASQIQRSLDTEWRENVDFQLLDNTERVLTFVQQLIRLFDQKSVEFSLASGYLNLGMQISVSLLSNVSTLSSRQLASSFSKAMESLREESAQALETGFSLQILWETLRPITATTEIQLLVQIGLEDLIIRFDEICRYLPQSRDSLSAVRSKLVGAYSSITTTEHPEVAFEALSQAVANLEQQILNKIPFKEHFGPIFDYVYQNIRLQTRTDQIHEWEGLAMFSPAARLQLPNPIDQSSAPNSLARLASIDSVILTDDSRIASRLCRQLISIESQPLGMLEYVKEELSCLVNITSSRTPDSVNAILALSNDVRNVVVAIMRAHFDLLSPRAKACFSAGGELDIREIGQIPREEVVAAGANEKNFCSEYINHIYHVLLMLNNPEGFDLEQLRVCLISLAISGLRMMAPEKPLDPSVQAQLSVELYDCRREELDSRIVGQRQFHQHAFGQHTSLVIRILEDELAGIGQRPPPPSVFRPKVTGLPQIQDVLVKISHLLAMETPLDEWLSPNAAQRHAVNLRSIIDRLKKIDRAYDDFIKPITWFTQILLQGLEMRMSLPHPKAGTFGQELARHTPLLAPSPENLQYWPDPVNTTYGHTGRLQWLRHAGLATSVYSSRGPTRTSFVQSLVNVVDIFYIQWKAQLRRDQADSEVQSRYYAYRGDGEKDEEIEAREMLDIFPDFERESVQERSLEQRNDARTTAIQVASLHQKFYKTQDSQDAIYEYLLDSMETMSKLDEDEVSTSNFSFLDALPAASLLMEKTLSSLQGRTQSTAFNIYTDSDTTQSVKLFDLVKHVQSRFHAIAEKWPEHAVPADVLSFCQAIMQLNLKEPVAKLLVAAEKLFEMISQWQSVASREWSVIEHVERLTALIVSWRRLELLSWSRLLDNEKKRHEDDAQAWYFVAYEAIVYNTIRIPAGTDVQPYCVELSETLEQFLRTTTLGQYSSRLNLLDDLRKTLADLAHHEQWLLPLHMCVANMVDHYRRYEQSIKEYLRTSRADIEKTLKEQVQLASWKDTNVTALRDSARRSHLKLFRVVKKYRTLLNQPVTIFKAPNLEFSLQGSSDLWQNSTESWSRDSLVAAARTICAEKLSDWATRPERLTDSIGAAKSIQRLYESVHVDFDLQLELASFREDLIESIKELKSQTPATSTDDNEAAVRHLQERKRRLFTDTVKAVTNMGIRRNLPTSELEKQSSAARVLALSPTDVSSSDIFHELLDAMSTSRASQANHSDDLTDGETNRSLGLLEGLLSVTINQRNSIGRTQRHLSKLSDTVVSLKALADESIASISFGDLSISQYEKMNQHITWLSEMIALSTRILSFQAQHANLDISKLLHDLQQSRDSLQVISKEFSEQSELPLGLTTTNAQKLYGECLKELAELKDTITTWQDQEPRIAALLSKLVPWTTQIPSTQNGVRNGISMLGVQEFDKRLRDSINQVFVALQDLPTLHKGFPSSVEDGGWLVKSDKAFDQTIKSLHFNTVGDAVQSLLDDLHCVKPEDFSIAVALVQVAAPIITQYYSVCDHVVRRQTASHSETCKLAIQLARSFTSLASEGFCRPSKSADAEEQSGKLESGTGLGDGEGAEDISKDVGDDEDLSELAQAEQGEKEKDGEMENAEDAVDMGNDELQGQTGDNEEQKSDDGEDDRSDGEEGDDIDEETGSVDDLDPTAVDEKMWDDMKKDSEEDKELKNDKAKGTKSDDQTAAEGENEDVEDMEGVEGEEEVEEDEGEGIERPEAENMDPHVEDENALDLPEELDFVGDDKADKDELSDDGMDDLSDIEGAPDETEKVEEVDGEHTTKSVDGDDTDAEVESDEEEPGGTAQDEEIMEDVTEDQVAEDEDGFDNRESNLPQEADEHAGGESGAANEIQEEIQEDQNVQGLNQSEKEPDPQQAQAGKAENEEQGDTGQGATERGVGRMDTVEEQQKEALRKLADVLDQWHQRREILPSSKPDEPDEEAKAADLDMAEADLEHVGDEQESDTQALGAASAEQAQALDHNKAIQDDEMPADEDTDMPDVLEPEQQENIAERFNRLQEQQLGQPQGLGALIPDRAQPRLNDSEAKQSEVEALEDYLPSDIENLDINHDQPHASPPTTTSDAAQLWNHCSTSTHQFSLVLTEQLRLILSPTTATKLRGDFRTGKRLNIKRIIPYIASGYKRDKIWMRRSVPSKRNYQIMIAVDDSKSMAESGADILAFETLALLTKSLSMLEVGEMCVIGFGDEHHVRVAHPFGRPFSPSESGVQIFQSFSFDQKGTDVKNMVKQSIQLFRDARIKGHSSSDDLWQLQLIVSDGHCSDHATVSRLVRQAQEEKIIIVFVIVDAGDESILDLKEAVFEQDPNFDPSGNGKPEMRVTTRRYLEDFPFPYYLVVRDVRDLPGVLATALKGWFGSVVDAQS